MVAPLAWALTAFLVASAGGFSSALGADFVVTKTADTNDGACNSDCSLREAIIAANASAGADRVILGSGLIYTLTIAPPDAAGALVGGSGDLDVTDALTIEGNGSTVDAAGIDRVFDIAGNFTVTINNLTIKNGLSSGFLSTGGGLNIRGASVVLNGCAVKGNSTALDSGTRDDGGGIAVFGSYDAASATATLAHLTLAGSSVSANTGHNGGGIVCALCALTIANSDITANVAEGGDGGGIDLLGNASTLSMTNSTLASNSAPAGRGGGLAVPFGTGISLLTLNRIANNTAVQGGAIFNQAGTINGDNNWWGCNDGPGLAGAGCSAAPNGVSGPFTMTRYLVLTMSAVPPTIPLNATSTVTANLTINSLGENTTAGGTVPNGIVAAFSGTNGSYASPTSPTSNGKAIDVYTATGPKAKGVNLSTTVDAQTVSAAINVGYQPFTDDPLIAGVTIVRAVHVTELRTRIDAIRSAHGLPPYSYGSTITIGVTVIASQHINDLRQALAQAYTAAGSTPPSYTDSPLTPGTVIKVLHIAQIRAAIIAME